MAQLPIIRPRKEGEPKFLFAMTITHPEPGIPPHIDVNWDGEWVKVNNLPPVFSQQIILQALQALFALGIVVASSGPPGPPEAQN